MPTCGFGEAEGAAAAETDQHIYSEGIRDAGDFGHLRVRDMRGGAVIDAREPAAQQRFDASDVTIGALRMGGAEIESAPARTLGKRTDAVERAGREDDVVRRCSVGEVAHVGASRSPDCLRGAADRSIVRSTSIR